MGKREKTNEGKEEEKKNKKKKKKTKKKKKKKKKMKKENISLGRQLIVFTDVAFAMSTSLNILKHLKM